ncbi:MAG: N-glycosylase/DNA lyase [Methanobacteriota archaeon]
MDKLVDQLLLLQHDDGVRTVIDTRIQEFHRLRRESGLILFEELCFCILTANCSAERCLSIQQEIGPGFSGLSEEDLRKRFKMLGYRFPPRAKHIVSARCFCATLPEVLASLSGEERREWLVRYIDGFGYKEASHFLRNIGYDEYAIIDSHIIDVLVKHQIIKKPKSLTKRKYLEIEQKLKTLGERVGLTLSELDLYLWYMETGKILK